jgi:cytochrome P450
MMHDAEVYPEPFTFKPERHIGPDAQPDPTPYVFGFGKRLCPGIHFGQLQLFLSVCSILSVFKISKAMDSKGEEIEPEITWRTSTVT